MSDSNIVLQHRYKSQFRFLSNFLDPTPRGVELGVLKFKYNYMEGQPKTENFLEEVLRLPLRGNSISHDNANLFSWSAPWDILNRIPEEEREEKMRNVIKKLGLPLDGGAANRMLQESI